MKGEFHREIVIETLQGKFDRLQLDTVLAANLHQDRPAGQIGHPIFHFDDNAFITGNQYLEDQRSIILETLASQGDPRQAWAAFGRLTHAAQDFYAHSNYVALWLASAPETIARDPALIDPLDERVLNSSGLRSGKIYLPWELLAYLPVVGKAAKALIPRDSHTWMNLDDPGRGQLFPFALAAAKKRTTIEYERILERIEKQCGREASSRFTGLETPI